MCCFVLGRACCLALYGMGRPLPLARPGALLCVGCADLCCCSLCLRRLRGGASATGAARWYMAAAMGLGALCWRWCVSHAVHRALRGTVFVLVWPLRFAADYAVHPFKQRLLARIRKIRHARRHNAQDSCEKSGKSEKMCCKTSTQYYIIKLYLKYACIRPSCAGRRYNGLHTTAF